MIFQLYILNKSGGGDIYDYILIASSFDEEITYQITEELHIAREKILHMDNIYIFIHDYWEKNYNLSKKRILCIGNENRYKQIKDIYIIAIQ